MVLVIRRLCLAQVRRSSRPSLLHFPVPCLLSTSSQEALFCPTLALKSPRMMSLSAVEKMEHKIMWFRVLLPNSRIIFKQIYLIHRWNHTIYKHSMQCGPGSNCNEAILYTLQRSKPGASLLVWFSLLWFHSISTYIDYLMPHSVFKYISNIWFVNIL